jgi:malate dehydrogenase (oxaloacetate-decarboxylating)(NADP+)
VFPGIGLGGIISKAKHITNSMILAAANGLANSLTQEERAKGDLYPSLKRIRDVSAIVAAHVCQVAEHENLLTNEKLQGKSIDELVQVMKDKMWSPDKNEKEIIEETLG